LQVQNENLGERWRPGDRRRETSNAPFTQKTAGDRERKREKGVDQRKSVENRNVRGSGSMLALSYEMSEKKKEKGGD